MAIKNAIPCGHGTCQHSSPNAGEHALHGALHFTASVMGNPDYLEATKDVAPSKDQRMVGLERLNSFHASAHEKRVVRNLKSWSQSK